MAALLPPPMKTSLLSYRLPLAALSLVWFGSLALPETTLAKPHDKSPPPGQSKKDKKGGDNRDRRGGNDHHDRDRESDYRSRPRSSFTLNLGTGYAGRGYYYGPPGAAYYYQRSDVRYYRTRELAPREYYDPGYRVMPVGVSVQRALARQGYYRGVIDGDIGPYSRRSIARYQSDHGLYPSGNITPALLRSLGLQ